MNSTMLSGWASAAATSPAATCGTTPSIKKFRCLFVRCSTSLASLAVSFANTSVRLRLLLEAAASAVPGLEIVALSSLAPLSVGSTAHASRSPPPKAARTGPGSEKRKGVSSH